MPRNEESRREAAPLLKARPFIADQNDEMGQKLALNNAQRKK